METLNLKESSEVSFLLGAGFSKPLCYPIGRDLNKKMLGFNKGTGTFSLDGTLVSGEPINSWISNPYQERFGRCIRLIQEAKEGFDYEEFFDTIKKEWERNEEYRNLEEVYQQMVAHCICDENQKCWYEDDPTVKGDYFKPYAQFLNILQKFAKNGLVHVHTLNHDLVFEGFRKTEQLSEKISDGFTLDGSCYYGKYKAEDESKNIQLRYYTGRYDTSIRFYKLHGSIDQVFFMENTDSVMVPKKCVKIRKGVGYGGLEKRDSAGGIVRSPFETHANFLTGKTTKERYYKDPVLYSKLFDRFKCNLCLSNKLIVIGYGFKDKTINEMVTEYFKHSSRQVYIVDPCPSEKVKEFARNLNAKIIQKSVEQIKEDEFE